MSPQTLTGICGGVTIRVANHTTTAIDTDVTNMKATIGICKTKKKRLLKCDVVWAWQSCKQSYTVRIFATEI